MRQQVIFNPLFRRGLLVAFDCVALPLSVWSSFAFRLATPWPQQLRECEWMFPAALILGLVTYLISGQYKGLTRYSGSLSLYQMTLRNLALTTGLALIALMTPLPAPPRSSWLIFWLMLTALTAGGRLLLRDTLVYLVMPQRRQPVFIYGAGAAGAQLLASLRLSPRYRVVAFIDDNPDLWGRHLNAIPIQPPQRLPRLRNRFGCDQVLLAMPSVSKARRRHILDQLQMEDLRVLSIPALDEIASGRTRIDDLRPVAITDLLGRDPVPPQLNLIQSCVRDRVVLVTGAGGSIGSELCRQITCWQPRQLIAFEQSEFALYRLEQELRPTCPGLLPILGSVLDRDRLEQIYRRYHVETVYHAAAYKHVPLVEANPLEGLLNNSFGTRLAAEAAIQAGVETFVLISTDKAVRPTNVMGASKRLAEQIVQGLQSESAHTRLCMVRFGNVLGSSGSVVPLFEKQIRAGGPITLTHPEIIRYFMTIPEAAQLVLQASAFAEGGDVFLLDMGEPIKILDLARQMIRLSGLTVRDENNPQGDIEIHCTGLRPGEKLYEELLISAEDQPTQHPLIRRAQENAPPWVDLQQGLVQLEQAIQQQNESRALVLLRQLVPDYQPAIEQLPSAA
ncbi:nucleoside-diphosphate sugar epimerase/dehydratase [Synechococcus elongatus IITB4]|uniref:polysaccharide biosynthesis protein n=1 Tax=Synechococcus elongatus TaxID=32046 RepID=UPI0030D1BC60